MILILSNSFCICWAQDISRLKELTRKNYDLLNFRSTLSSTQSFLFREDYFITTHRTSVDVSFTFLNKLLVPFSIVITDRTNTFSNGLKDIKNPFIKVGLSPSWKNFKLHLGWRNLSVLSNSIPAVNLLGGGIEHQIKNIRYSIFYGLRNKLQEDRMKRYVAGAGIKTTSRNINIRTSGLFFFDKNDPIVLTQKKRGYAGSVGIEARMGKGFNAEGSLTATLIERSTGEFTYSSENIPQPVEMVSRIVTQGYQSDLALSRFTKKSRWTVKYLRITPGFNLLHSPFTENDKEDYGINITKSFLDQKLTINANSSYSVNNVTSWKTLEQRRLANHLNTEYAVNGFRLSANYSLDRTWMENITQVNQNIQLGNQLVWTKGHKKRSLTSTVNFGLSDKYFSDLRYNTNLTYRVTKEKKSSSGFIYSFSENGWNTLSFLHSLLSTKKKINLSSTLGVRADLLGKNLNPSIRIKSSVVTRPIKNLEAKGDLNFEKSINHEKINGRVNLSVLYTFNYKRKIRNESRT